MENVKPYTVILLCPSLNLGGVERGVVDIAIHLKKQGYNTVVISNGGKLLSQLFAHSVEHIALPIHSKNPLTFLYNLWRLRSLIGKWKPDLLLPHSRIPTWLIYLSRKMGCNVPFVSHCFGMHRMQSGKMKKLYNSVLMKGDRIIANSNFTKDYFLGYFPEAKSKIRVVPRWVDLDFFDISNIEDAAIEKQRREWKLKDGQIALLFPTRISKRKGIEILIRAIAILNKQYGKRFYVVILGDYEAKYSYYQQLCSLIEKNNVKENIYWAGSTNLMSLAYAAADAVLAISTQPEAFGRTVIEAHAMGKLVVGSAHGGVLETIEDNVTGFLVEPDNAEALVTALIKILQMEPSIKQEIEQQAQNQSKNFSLHRLCQDTLDIYKALLS